jgi:hypothetical protein
MHNRTLDTRFVWWKPESGFEWGTRKGDRQLRWKSEKKGGYSIRRQPHPRLFRVFAALRVTRAGSEEGILGFANEHGDILALPGSSFYQQDNGGGRRTVRRHAMFSLWRHQVQQMRWAVGLWDQCNDATARKATRLQARKDLQLEIESALRDLTTPSCARVCLNQKLELFVYPVNLLAFMWLTLARLVSGEIVEQPCMGKSKGCLGYIYTGLGPGLKKTGTVTCSIACRKWKERHNA